MATTWEDVQRELAYEKEMEDFETELALVKKDTVKKFISTRVSVYQLKYQSTIYCVSKCSTT